MALPYGPGPTRVRSRMLLAELAPRHAITLIGLAAGPEDVAALGRWRERGVEVHVVPHDRKAQARATLGDPRRPLQQIVATSAAFARLVRETLATAARAGRPYDAVHVEHLRGAAALRLTERLPVRTVFDAVDCIAELARLARRHSPTPLVRALSALEEARTRRYERALVAAADAVVVVAERDRRALAATVDAGAARRICVIANGVALADAAAGLDEPLAIFTGKLSYHANLAALRWLLDDIWPRVRAAVPTARLLIAGAAPPAWVRRVAGRAGISVQADPPAIPPLIAGARVALAPLTYGVGIQNKVLEALACGVPVVATPQAVEGLPIERAHGCVIAHDPAAFAARTVELLRDRDAAAAIGRAGRDYVAREHRWATVAGGFEALYIGQWPHAGEMG